MGLSVLKIAYRTLIKIIKIMVVGLSAALVIIVFSNVVSRYFLQSALAWSEETARFLFIWITFLGAILANADQEHMRLDMVIKYAPKKVGLTLNVVADLILVAILCFLLNGGFIIVAKNLDWMTPALDIPYGLVYTIVPISCIILILQTLVKLLNDVKILFKNEKTFSNLSQ